MRLFKMSEPNINNQIINTKLKTNLDQSQEENKKIIIENKIKLFNEKHPVINYVHISSRISPNKKIIHLIIE
jgi:hypothetical protein